MPKAIPYSSQNSKTLKSINNLKQIKVDKKNNQSVVPTAIYSSSTLIKQMRNEWKNDLIQIHNKLDNIEIELEKLERLCKQLNNLLGGNESKDNSFSPIISEVTNIKKNFQGVNDNVVSLKIAVDNFKLEDDPKYKKIKDKQDKKEIENIYKKLQLQTKLVFNNINNMNSIKVDNKREEDDSSVVSAEDESSDKSGEHRSIFVSSKSNSSSESSQDELSDEV